MSEANSVNDLKARALDLLRRAGWDGAAGRLERGDTSVTEAHRMVRDALFQNRRSDADRVALDALDALAAAERSASTDIAHATVTIAELRAHCDALRADIATLTVERDSVREQLRQVHAICAGAPNESAVEAVQRTRERRDALEAELTAARAERTTAQATLDEALAIQSQIWDAVGGQREGESLVDAVRRISGQRRQFFEELKQVDAAVGRGENEDLVDAVRRVVSELREEREKRRTVQVNAQRTLFEQERSRRWLPKPERVEAGQWWCVENGAGILGLAMQVVSGPDPNGGYKLGNERGICGAYGNDMLTFPRWRYLGNGERPIETNEGCGYCGDVNCNDVPAKEASVSKLDDVLSVASEEVAKWPEYKHSDDVKRRRAEFDARMEALGTAGQRRAESDTSAQWVSRSRTEQREANGATTFEQVHHALRFRPDLQAAFDAEVKRAADEAREAGRAEAKAEIERLREKVESLDAALTRREVDIDRVSMERDMFREERDAAYRSGQVAMRERAAALVDDEADDVLRAGSAVVDRRKVAARIRALPIANAPTASASEGPGEAGPGSGGTETAGAGESVAREWREATGCETPSAVREHIASLRSVIDGDRMQLEQRLNEIDGLKSKLAKARNERSRSDDALKAIEEALLSAGVAPQSDESLADTVRRALENRDVRAPKVERSPQVGDIVLLHDGDGEDPAVVLNVGENEGGEWVNLRNLYRMTVWHVVRRGSTQGTWRFRD